ncbi:MAG: stage II sporulation protein R [Lachnospiraceae bacterium]|nr:stage II sporulation protein R [Lachnospiraceae bacterium]
MYHLKKLTSRFRFSALIDRLQFALAVLFILLSILLLLPEHLFSDETAAPSLALEDRILRLHILAADDDTASQEIKLHVRDAVLALVREPLAEATTAAEAEAALLPLLDDIVRTANETLEQYGVSYLATAELSTEFFPIKQYGSLLLPPGEYRALRICLGDAEGKNWWCMLYPSLCFTEGITATIDEDEKEELRGLLTEEEYDTLFSEEEAKPVFCFRLAELWKKLKRWFS